MMPIHKKSLEKIQEPKVPPDLSRHHHYFCAHVLVFVRLLCLGVLYLTTVVAEEVGGKQAQWPSQVQHCNFCYLTAGFISKLSTPFMLNVNESNQ